MDIINFKEIIDFKEIVDFVDIIDFKEIVDFEEIIDFIKTIDFMEIIDFMVIDKLFVLAYLKGRKTHFVILFDYNISYIILILTNNFSFVHIFFPLEEYSPNYLYHTFPVRLLVDPHIWEQYLFK
jgi:hypothetical protein